jgi:hypothetical protein
MVNEPVFVTLTEDILNQYAGQYAAAGMKFEVVPQGTTVAVKMGEQGPFALEARSETLFSFELAAIAFEFVRDETGAVNAIKVNGQGMDVTAQRVVE